ncbi:GDP-mannose 4,6-dehydratase, partial [Francisella tularensis subsp. holarctica]|uniref:GDP-mannose 4,6-dehydratase n=1 Tax=Francisella tularensis TaxID=263 RepID=UPI002381C114
MNYKPKNILVTGAAGFIGSNYVRIMLSRYSDIKIISYDNLTYAGSLDNRKDLNNEHNNIFIIGDICD